MLFEPEGQEPEESQSHLRPQQRRLFESRSAYAEAEHEPASRPWKQRP
jgi:hypothetical protein